MSSPRISTPNRSRMGIAPSPKKKGAPRNSPMKQLRPVAIGSKVRVVARIRPVLEPEQEKGCIRIVANGDEQSLEIEDSRNRTESYKPDSCYGENDDSSKIFKVEAEPVLPLLFCGCDATIFAYGTPGSGKTYTMQGCEDKPGLITLSIQRILSLAAEKTNWSVEVSYYELYLDQCYDLLQPTGLKLPAFEDSQGRIQLRGLSQVQVKQLGDFESAFGQACTARKSGQTASNGASSRSHTVLTITVTNVDELNSSYRLVGKLNLIDLAGNENGANTDNQLSVLSNVISAATANERRVPYRDSKLTRILQDSLSGTSSTVMIACLNPGSFVEGCRTLSLGARTKLIGEISETSSNKGDADSKVSDKKKPPKSPLKLSSPVHSKLFKSPRVGQQRHASKRILASPSCSPRKDANIFSIYEDMPVLEPSTSDEATEGQTADTYSEDETANPEDKSQQHSLEKEADKENLATLCTPVQHIESSPSSPLGPPLSSMLRSLGTSLKEVSTPGTLVRSIDFTSQTPSTNIGWTAVEKFTVSSRDLRSSLLKDYLDILNTGAREELLTLKGIGNKRADYILELRTSSEEPFVQLRDLEKIGLSAKQAQKLFHGSVVRKVLEL